MPQVASTAVISPPVRSDAPARTLGQIELSGIFGEMLDASSIPGCGMPVPDNSKESPAPAAQDDQVADSLQTANASIPLVLAIDLALLTPELCVEGSAATSVTATEVADGDAPANGDAITESTKTEVSSDAASVIIGPKAAEVAITVVLAPPPAPAAAPAQADTDAAAIAPNGPKASPVVATPTNATAEAQVEAPAAEVDLPPVAAGVDDAALLQPAKSTEKPAETVPANGTATLDEAAQGEAIVLSARRPVTEAVNGKVEDKTAQSGETAAALPGPTETKPSPRPVAEIANGKSVEKNAPSSKAVAHSTDAPHAGKAAQAHPSTDAPRSAEQRADLDAKAPHQPHAQPSEHASPTARVAAAAAHSDLAAPTSVAPAVTAQVASAPPLFGLNVAMPLASPLQALWHPAARADSTDNTIPISGLAVEIVSRVHEGLRRFEIRLDPPELGRIDVRLDVDRGGNVTSRLTIERAETLDLLRRDAPQLERALQQAGLNTESGLQFSLRDQNFANREQTHQNAATLIVPDDEPAAADAALRGYGRLIGLGGGVDIRV